MTTPGLLAGFIGTAGTWSVNGRGDDFLPAYCRCGACWWERDERSAKPFLSNGPTFGEKQATPYEQQTVARNVWIAALSSSAKVVCFLLEVDFDIAAQEDCYIKV